MFRFLTAGESHGPGLTCVIEGLPAGLELDEDFIAVDLRRRQGGYGRGGRMLIEKDRAQIRAGVRFGMTIGSPVALWIENKDWVNWQERMSITPIEAEAQAVTRLRPGHADMAGALKYGHDDVRNVLERASARETVSRVAVGAVAKRLLQAFGVCVHSHVVAIGSVEVRPLDHEAIDWDAVEDSPVRCADPAAEERMIELIDDARENGDTLGGVYEVVALGCPIGLGSHVHWDRRLDGRIAGALMSIQAAKGVEIGAGFTGAHEQGSRVHDVMTHGADGKPVTRLSNRAGGIEGGMTNGEPVLARVGMKPISTLSNPLPSIDLRTGETVKAHYERSDVCVVPAAGVVGEAMVSIVLAQALLEKFGGDSVVETRRNLEAFLESVRAMMPA